MLKLWWY